MKFTVDRVSLRYKAREKDHKPYKDAVFKDGDWVIEINTLEELMEVVHNSCEPGYGYVGIHEANSNLGRPVGQSITILDDHEY